MTDSILPMVYTLKQVAETLQISEEDVEEMMSTGELESFSVLDGRYRRIPEHAMTALVELRRAGSAPNNGMQTPNGKPSSTSSRKRDPAMERRGRELAIRKMQEVSPDLYPDGRKRFTANGKQGVLCVSTPPSGPRQEYWMGFPGELLHACLPTLIVAVLADKQIAFVISYESFKAALDGLSSDRGGHKKFTIGQRSGKYYFAGKGIQNHLSLD